MQFLFKFLSDNFMIISIVTLFLYLFDFVQTQVSCPTSYYNNGGNCVSCAVVCWNCDINGCTQCLAANHRYLSGTQCVPMPGYYESNQPVAGQCPDVGCKSCHPNSPGNCNDCFQSYYLANNDCYSCDPSCYTCNNANTCTGCHPQYYLSGSSCLLCASTISNCILCSDSSTCGSCESEFYVNSSNQCAECISPCQTCQSASICSSCEEYYQLNDTTCTQICGDGVAINHPCDLGLIAGDGCTDNCQIQENFKCKTVDKKSICTYTGPITLQYNTYKPIQNTSQIQIYLNLSPNLKIFSQLQLLDYLSLSSDDMKILNYTLNEETGELILNVQYSSSLIDQNITVTLNIPENDITSSSTSSADFQIDTLYYYDYYQYLYTHFVWIFSIILLTFGWLACLLGLATRKLAGLQIMIVIQYGWFLLLWFPNVMQPEIEELMLLKYINGYNYYIASGETQSEPPYISTFNMSRKYFWENFNVNFVFYGVILLMMLISRIVYKFTSSELSKTLYRSSYQLLMYVCMLNLVYLLSCSLIFFSYGDLEDVGSYFAFIIPMLITIIVYIRFWFHPDPFGRFRYSFRKNTLAFKHYYIYATFIILCVLFVRLLHAYQWAACIVMGLYMGFIGLFRPYINLIENIRVIFYTSLMVFGTAINIYSQNTDPVTLTNNTIFAIQGCYLILIFLGILWSIFESLKDLYQKCTQKTFEENMAEKTINFEKQLSMETARAQKMRFLSNPAEFGGQENIFQLMKANFYNPKQLLKSNYQQSQFLGQNSNLNTSLNVSQFPQQQYNQQQNQQNQQNPYKNQQNKYRNRNQIPNQYKNQYGNLNQQNLNQYKNPNQNLNPNQQNLNSYQQNLNSHQQNLNSHQQNLNSHQQNLNSHQQNANPNKQTINNNQQSSNLKQYPNQFLHPSQIPTSYLHPNQYNKQTASSNDGLQISKKPIKPPTYFNKLSKLLLNSPQPDPKEQKQLQIQLKPMSNPINSFIHQNQKKSHSPEALEQIHKLMLSQRKFFMLQQSIKFSQKYGLKVDPQKLEDYKAL